MTSSTEYAQEFTKLAESLELTRLDMEREFISRGDEFGVLLAEDLGAQAKALFALLQALAALLPA